jgi:predicted nucleotidyltransferase component of viral defense system
MRRLSARHVDTIRDVVNDNLVRFRPGALEKDAHISIALEALSMVDIGAATIHFGGGTSLVKAHRVIDRMSEDVDMSVRLEEVGSPSSMRQRRGKIRDALREVLLSSGYHVTDIPPRNENRYFGFGLQYGTTFEDGVSLRPEIKLEFNVIAPTLPTQIITTSTLLGEIVPEYRHPVDVSCKQIEETLAEKVISYLRRTRPIVRAQPNQYEDRLVRHIYDVHALEGRELKWELAQRAFTAGYENDIARYGNQDEALRANPRGELKTSLESMSLTEIEPLYASFVSDLLAYPGPEAGEAVDSFRRVARTLLSG